MTDPSVNKTAAFYKQNITEELITYIKDQILMGHLNPGDRIVESRLAKELGLSQTPVREALRHLQGEGLITIIPNKGTIVSPLDDKAVYEIYSVRALFEGLAIRTVTKQATAEEIAELERLYETMKEKLHDDSVAYLLKDSFYIHEKIVHLSKHAKIISMYRSISFQIALLNRTLGTTSSKQKEVDTHLELIEVIKQGDPDAAEKTMRAHIYRSYMEFVQVAPNPPIDPYNGDEQLWV
ncbi:GntR family transcriptional regulator [Paenibacillus mesophilus]|uniref:GntR family transcriptional regulator n=1 Tax=Paenibacillus mesophilus TaxID=2582849 RepID=UPI00110F62B0|nr:GntR family transcriptional regulator [Paenibacillus mesophilus]TMV44705.1 GntR family transcriptional regulator [Paenibacillus mesophilus]